MRHPGMTHGRVVHGPVHTSRGSGVWDMVAHRRVIYCLFDFYVLFCGVIHIPAVDRVIHRFMVKRFIRLALILSERAFFISTACAVVSTCMRAPILLGSLLIYVFHRVFFSMMAGMIVLFLIH
jgi:hypothetical protein